MENKKITVSLTTIIIVSAIIGALVLALVCFVIYNNINNQKKKGVEKWKKAKKL